MATDHRWTDSQGNRIDFSCGNIRYHTNVDKGYRHGTSLTKGSVFKDSLISHGYSLWLEYVVGHVKGKETGEEVFWLMWYDKDGVPTIPMSGVFDRAELAEMVKQLASFVP